MTEHEWGDRYAPRGYQFHERVFTFDQMYDSDEPARLFAWFVEDMKRFLELQCLRQYSRFDPTNVFTRITLHPLDTGEHMNLLDPLKLRYGLKINMRHPLIHEKP